MNQAFYEIILNKKHHIKEKLMNCYNVGKLLLKLWSHYRDGIIKEYSKRLTKDIGRGYSERNLRNMRQLWIKVAELRKVLLNMGKTLLF